MPVIEFAWFSASESFKADHSLIDPALDHISKAEGCINVYYGFTQEDKEMVYLAIVWETYEHHQALLDHPSSSSLSNKFKPIFGAIPLTMNHVEIQEGDFSAVFASPITEVLTAKAKDGKSQEELTVALRAMGDLVASAGPPSSGGEVREDPCKILIIIGWESVKAHDDITLQEKFVKPARNLREVGDLQIVYVHFIKYA